MNPNPSPFDAMVARITQPSVKVKKDQGVVKASNDGGPPSGAPTAPPSDGSLPILTEEQKLQCIKECNDNMKKSDEELTKKCQLVRKDVDTMISAANKTLYDKRKEENVKMLNEMRDKVKELEKTHGLPDGVSCMRCFTLRAIDEPNTFGFEDKNCTQMSAALQLGKRKFKNGCEMDTDGDGVPNVVCANGVCSTIQPGITVPLEDYTVEELEQIIEDIEEGQGDDQSASTLGTIDDFDNLEVIGTRRGRRFPYIQPAMRTMRPAMRPATRPAARYAMPYMQPTKRPQRVKYQYF
jgi:hypothetical protein